MLFYIDQPLFVKVCHKPEKPQKPGFLSGKETRFLSYINQPLVFFTADKRR
jgi:hypothetical protein